MIFKSQQEIQRAFSLTLNDLENSFITTMKTFGLMIKKNIATDCFYVFDVLECIHVTSGNILLSTDTSVFNFDEPYKDLKRTAQESFEELLKHTEMSVQALSSLPADFAVLDTTKDFTSRLLRFGDYDTILASILTPIGPPSKWQLRLNYSTVFQTGNTVNTKSSYHGTEILSIFMADCIDTLIVNIEIKAKSLTKKSPPVGLQVITNLMFVERMVKRDPIISSILGGFGGLERLEKLKKRAMNIFLEGWKTCAAHLMDATVVRNNSTTSRGNMSSKDREAIKEKFRVCSFCECVYLSSFLILIDINLKNFNSDFEDLISRFKNYNIADAEVRAYLAKEVAFISPLYYRFYERHKAGDFSKHTEKVSLKFIADLFMSLNR